MFLWGFPFPWEESQHVFRSVPWACVRECAEG